MPKRFQEFLRDESAAVSVDWVVLTAVIVSMILMLFTILTESVYTDATMAIVDDMGTAVAY